MAIVYKVKKDKLEEMKDIVGSLTGEMLNISENYFNGFIKGESEMYESDYEYFKNFIGTNKIDDCVYKVPVESTK